MSAGGALRIAVAHRGRLERDLVDSVLTDAGLDVVARVTTVAALLDVARDLGPDVVITDSCLDDGSLIGAVSTLVAAGCRVLVLSEDESTDTITAMLLRGASGYLILGAATVAHVVDAVRSVSDGDAALNPAVAAAVLDQWRRSRTAGHGGSGGRLTARELEVLAAMAQGMAAKAIARELGLAVKTVENHKARVFEKLGAKNQANAVAIASARGLLRTEPEESG